MKDARSLSLSWHLRSLLQGGRYCAGRSLPDWLKEVRSLRGSVLFDNGRRRNFRAEEGRPFDADPIDLYAYHILAYDARQLNPRFLRIMDEMAKTIGIRRRFVKFDHLFRQKIEAKQLAPFGVGQ